MRVPDDNRVGSVSEGCLLGLTWRRCLGWWYQHEDGCSVRSCENTGSWGKKKHWYQSGVSGLVARLAHPAQHPSPTARKWDNWIEVSPCGSKFLFLICCERIDIIQDQYLVFLRDHHFKYSVIPNNTASTYQASELLILHWTCLFISVWSSC